VRRAAETVPSICLHVDTAPGTFPPPSKPYLQGMADPAETDGYTMLSFYRFSEISVPEEIAQALTELWKPFKTYGKSQAEILNTYDFTYCVSLSCSSHECQRII
jgi:hypothetical protein